MNINDIKIEGIENLVVTARTNRGNYDLKFLLPDNSDCEFVSSEDPVTKRGRLTLKIPKYDGITIMKHKEEPMKINICSTKLDLAILNERLRDFEEETNEIPYIFMNKETCETIKTMIVPSFSHGTPTISIEDIKILPNFKGEYPYIDKYIVEYKGKKVYKDDTLEFGEIELR